MTKEAMKYATSKVPFSEGGLERRERIPNVYGTRLGARPQLVLGAAGRSATLGRALVSGTVNAKRATESRPIAARA